MRSGGRGTQNLEGPQYPLIYNVSREIKIGEHIETGSAIHEVIHIRAIRRARRPPFLTPHS